MVLSNLKVYEDNTTSLTTLAENESKDLILQSLQVRRLLLSWLFRSHSINFSSDKQLKYQHLRISGFHLFLMSHQSSGPVTQHPLMPVSLRGLPFSNYYVTHHSKSSLRIIIRFVSSCQPETLGLCNWITKTWSGCKAMWLKLMNHLSLTSPTGRTCRREVQ